jgi:phage gp36-like protein
MFATRQDLLTRCNARRLAQLAIPADMAMVALDVVRTALTGGSITSEPIEVQTAVAAALTTIDQALADAHELIVSYGVPTSAASTLLTRMCCTVALYYLQGIERLEKTDALAYDGVLKLLEQHKRGLVDLTPAADAIPPTAGEVADMVEMSSSPGRFGSSDVDDGNEGW